MGQSEACHEPDHAVKHRYMKPMQQETPLYGSKHAYHIYGTLKDSKSSATLF